MEYIVKGDVNTGVPQGSILGPLLFILYINDLLQLTLEGLIVSFADDTALVVYGKTWLEVEMRMNDILAKVSEWLALNDLALNVDKTVCITFGNYSISIPKTFNIHVNNNPIKRVDRVKYLGIYFDYRLTWEHHIEFIINKTKYLIFIFKKFSRVMHPDTLLILYYAFFHSIMSYGVIAWGGVSSIHKNMIQLMQNKILKIIFKDKYLTVTKPLNLDQLFAYQSLKFYYDNLKNHYKASKSITRNKSIVLPKIYKNIGTRNSYIRAIFAFNCLPLALKTIENKNHRKIILKKWIYENVQ